MELTGKAYWSFRTWIFDAQGIKPKFIDDLNYKLLQCYIIEWLDSVGIYIIIEIWHREKGIMYWGWQIGTFERWVDKSKKSEYISRQQATEKAIERAIEIYNSK